MAGKKGMFDGKPNKATAERRADNWRESIKASSLLKRLKDHADGKLEKPMDATQIKATEIILARLVPTLSAVEQTIVDETAGKSETELLAALIDHLKAHPDVAQALGVQFIPPNTNTDTHVTH
jgi:hypothetical protein